MITLRLPPKVEKKLATAARKQHVTKTALVREALISRLEDIEDLAAATAAMKSVARGESRIWSAAEIKRELDL